MTTVYTLCIKVLIYGVKQTNQLKNNQLLKTYDDEEGEKDIFQKYEKLDYN